MKKNLACIGGGYWGRNLVRNFAALGALRSVCEVDAATRARLEKEYAGVRFTGSLDEIFGDPEVHCVAIATPAESHGEIVRRALHAGKDVFVEKPLCLSVTEGRELVSLAAAKGRILMVGHLLRYHPAIEKLKALVDAGDLGRLRYIYSNRLNLGRIRSEENILWSFAPHDMSVILSLVGQVPDAITAQGGNYLHEKVADATVSLLSFPSGVKAHIFVSWLHPFKEQKLVVVGDRKMAVFDDVSADHKLVLYSHEINWRNNMPVAVRAEPEPVAVGTEEPLRFECRHFLECVETRRTPRTDGEEGLRVLEVLERCQAALEEKPAAAAAAGHASTPAAPDVSRAYFAHETAFIDEGVRNRRGDVHLARLSRAEELPDRKELPHRTERGDRPERGRRRRRQDPEQRVGLRGRDPRGRRVLRPVDGVHQRVQPPQRDSPDGRNPPDARAPRRDVRSQLHHRLRRDDRPVRFRRRRRRGHARRAGLRPGRRKPGEKSPAGCVSAETA